MKLYFYFFSNVHFLSITREYKDDKVNNPLREIKCSAENKTDNQVPDRVKQTTAVACLKWVGSQEHGSEMKEHQSWLLADLGLNLRAPVLEGNFQKFMSLQFCSLYFQA